MRRAMQNTKLLKRNSNRVDNKICAKTMQLLSYEFSFASRIDQWMKAAKSSIAVKVLVFNQFEIGFIE